MISFRLLIALFLGFMNSVSYAQSSSEIIKTDHIQLMGRGFYNPESKDAIALGCKNEDCSILQFIYFRKDGEAFFIGHPILVPQAPTQKLKDKAIALVVEEYFYTHQTKKSAEQIDRAMIRRGGVMVFGLAAAAYVIATGGLGAAMVPALLGLSAATVTFSYVASSSKSMNKLVTGKHTTATMNDHEGWNWSIDPVMVKASNFNSLANRIWYGVKLSDTGVYGSFKRDQKMRDHIYKKRRKLREKGVMHLRDNFWGYH